MVSGIKLVVAGSLMLALGLATDVGAQTVNPVSSQQVEVFGAASSTAPILKGGKHKGKKGKHKKNAKRHNKKAKHQGKGKRKAKA